MNGRDDALIELLTTIVRHPAGFEVSLFADLSVGSLEDGRFRVMRSGKGAVSTDPHSDRFEAIFEDAGDAVRCFLATRKILRAGLDFEVSRV